MTKDQAKPRRWKLALDEYGDLLGDEQTLSSTDGLELIHVIEISAVQALQEQLADAKDSWTKERMTACLIQERDEMKWQLEQTKALLKTEMELRFSVGTANEKRLQHELAEANGLLTKKAEMIIHLRNDINDRDQQLEAERKAAIELFKRWDGLGKYKDDDFGEVAEAMEILKNFICARGKDGG